MLISTPIEYLLGRVFLLEHKWYLTQRDEPHAAFKALRKCLELNEQHSLECLREDQSVRREIADMGIIAYYECFKLKRQ